MAPGVLTADRNSPTDLSTHTITASAGGGYMAAVLTVMNVSLAFLFVPRTVRRERKAGVLSPPRLT